MADNKLLGAGSLYFGGNEISKAYMGSTLVWEKVGETGPDYSKEYFCIEAVEDCVITFAPQATIENGHEFLYIIAASRAPQMDLVYTMFENGDYEVFDPYADTSLTISLYSGDIVYMVGNMDKGVAKYNTNGLNSFTFSGKVNLSGNIMSLTHGLDRNTLEPTRPEDLPEKTYTYSSNRNVGELQRLFKNQPVVDAGNLVLSSSILNNYTYWEMFCGCTYLTAAPAELPALTVYQFSYSSMFDGCTPLTTAPIIKATSIANQCFRNMFRNCTSLTTAPELPATTLATNCYYQMFYGCTSLTTAPALPATTLKSTCYRGMFYGCTSLTTAPELPATTLVSSCYYQMFYGCTKLNYIKAMFTTTPSTSYTRDWVNGVSATGTFVKNTAATWDVTGVNGIPEGWTVQTASS